MFKYVFLILILGCSSTSYKRTPTSENPVKHVVLIGVDGLGGKYLEKAKAPHIKALMKSGSYSLKMKNVHPSQSAPNWFSLFSGLENEHGLVKFNDRPKNFHHITTFFKSFKLQRPSEKIGAFYDWKGIKELIEPAYLDQNTFKLTSKSVAWYAGRFFTNESPLLTFVYFGEVDVAGHRYGFGGKNYFSNIETVDERIGHILSKLEQNDLKDRTVVVLVSDHGGEGHTHGEDNEYHREVPFIISGPGIKKDHEIDSDINIYDVAPTLSHILSLAKEKDWKGKIVKDAFVDEVSEDIPHFNISDKEGFFKATAALNNRRGVSYFFKEGSFVRFELNGARYSGGPNSNWNYIGLSNFSSGPNDIDAAFDGGNGFTYFFKGKDYMRFNVTTDKPSVGYPKRISNQEFRGLSKFIGNNLDAAFYYGNSHVYFFKGNKVLKFNMKKNRAVSGYPRLISEEFQGTDKFIGGAKDIDAAINWSNGKAYLFKKNQFMRIDLKTHKVDDDFPKELK